MEYKERLELYELNKYVLDDKILPLVRSDDLRIKVEYWFRMHNIEFYPITMPIYPYEESERWINEAKEELKRIDKEHYIRLFDE